MKKIVIFSGAGLDKESGIPTFRDSDDGLWNQENLEQVATPQGWKKDKERVLDFYNKRRVEMSKAQPNSAHIAIAELENDFDVINITQNISDLLERGGATKVYHIHGEINKARSTVDPKLILDWKKPINIGDKCEKGSQLRPHVVWFYEYPFFIVESVREIKKADYLIVIGTGLDIHYTTTMIGDCNNNCKIYYVDPNPSGDLEKLGRNIIYIKDPATIGIIKVIKEIKDDNIQ